MQLWLWLRWILWQAWVSCWRVVRHRGHEVAAQEGIARRKQAWRIVRLALGWCIPPGEAYRFGLYRHPERALEFVYEHEVPAYHALRSRPLGRTRASIALLQDKYALAQALSARGVPMVASGACLPARSRGQPLAGLMAPWDRVFCKTRSGQQGLGAFVAWRTADGLRGRALAGCDLVDAAAVEAAWTRLLNLDDALIQPCLANHPLLAPLSFNDDAITVRLISEWRGATLACRCAVLQVPTSRDERTDHTRYTGLPVATASGRVQPWPRPEALPSRTRAAMDRLWALIPAGLLVPDWPALVAGSYRAHQCFPDLWGIAWDWVIAPDGPILLEGNAGWGAAIPQILAGGLLADDRN